MNETFALQEQDARREKRRSEVKNELQRSEEMRADQSQSKK